MDADLPCLSSHPVPVTLEECDIEGASLDEPLQSHTMEQLRWWLLCHGLEAKRSDKKQKLIERYNYVGNTCIMQPNSLCSFFLGSGKLN